MSWTRKIPTNIFQIGLKPQKINKYLYTLNYEFDYGLDELLSEGVSNTFQLARFVQKRFSLKRIVSFNAANAGCTTFNFINERNGHCLARNFDYKDGPCIVVRTNPRNGYKSIGVAAMNVMLYGFSKKEDNNQRLLMAPYACMDGINEKGLSIAILEIKTSPTKQGRKDAITPTVAIRAALDKCATVEEVITFFKCHSMNDALGCNYHYHIADAEGNTAVVEYVNNEIRIINKEKFTHVENFFLSKDGNNKKGFGFTRAKTVETALRETNGIMPESDAMSILGKCVLNYRHRRGYMVKTLWSAIYNCQDKCFTMSVGSDYSKNYFVFVNGISYSSPSSEHQYTFFLK